MASEQEEANIRVAVRVRPLNPREKDGLVQPVVTCVGKTVRVTYGGGTKDARGKKTPPNEKSYQFDNVFGMYSTQSEVFNTMVAPSCDECLAGFNCTIFAYGQTGTGKTHTMEGCVDDAAERGIIPRSVHRIFENLESKKCDFSVKVSYLEIYNEELNDLLGEVQTPEELAKGARRGENLKMKTSTAKAAEERSKKLMLCDSAKGVVCNNLVETICESSDEVLACVAKGAKTRKVVATLMNAESSRSHSIFTLKVMIKEVTFSGEQVRFGQLNLVDLAGSEDVQRSGATGKALSEAKNINKSLLTLGRVINNLTDGINHIPYRDSKLTRLLQESLGGRAKTTIIATLSPAEDSAEESNSTLEYAQRARSIKNKPVSNSTASKSAVLKECGAEMEEMRLMLQAQRDKAGTFLPTEKYEAMCREMDASRVQVVECEAALELLREEVEAEKQRADGLAGDLAFSTKACAKASAELASTKATLGQTECALAATALELDASEAVVRAQGCTEASLTAEATRLGRSLACAQADVESLLSKVARAAADADGKAHAAARFGGAALASTAGLAAQAELLQAAVAAAGRELEALLAAALDAAAAARGHLGAISCEHDHTVEAAAASHGASGAVQAHAMERDAAARGEASAAHLKAEAATVAAAAGEVASAVAAAADAMRQQRAALAALAAQVATAAVAAEERTGGFVAAQSAALAAARAAHGDATAAALAAVAAQQAQLGSFAWAQRAGLEGWEADLARQRAEAEARVAAALREEQAAASARAAEAAAEADTVRAAVAAEADQLLAAVAAAVAALKSKHADATLAASTAATARTAEAAAAHAASVGTMVAASGAEATALEQSAAGALAAAVSGFETAAAQALSASAAAAEAADATAGDASGTMAAAAATFGAAATNALRAAATDAAHALGSVDALAAATADELSALASAHAAHAEAFAAASEQQLVEAAAAAAQAAAAAAALAAHSAALPSAVRALGSARAAGVGAALDALAAEASCGAAAVRGVAGANGSLEQAAGAAAAAHGAAAAELNAAVAAHVEAAKAELEPTGGTPVKRVFERQAELSKTADHATIKQAARETSRRGYATILADAQAPAMETDEGGRVSSAGGVKRDSTEAPPQTPKGAQPSARTPLSATPSSAKHKAQKSFLLSGRNTPSRARLPKASSALSGDSENTDGLNRGKLARGDSVGDVVRNPLGDAN